MTHVHTFRRSTRPIRRRPRPNPGDDPAYRVYILSLPCLVCARHGFRQCTATEGHHYGPRGLSQKAPDRRMLPLCRVHHRTGSAAIHVLGKRFAGYHGLDLEAEVWGLNARFGVGSEAT
jgi:hypothetical protein